MVESRKASDYHARVEMYWRNTCFDSAISLFQGLCSGKHPCGVLDRPAAGVVQNTDISV
jgi:hypothetical protein